MKKITAILIALLLVITFVACVDNDQGDMDGDVHLPGVESGNNNGVESTNNTPSESSTTSGGGGTTDANGNIDLPIDWFD